MGCGGSGDATPAGPPPAHAERTPAGGRADLVFGPKGPEPRRVVLEAAPDLTLRLAARDGRPHGVRITVPGGPRVIVPPAGQVEVRLGDVAPGRYEIVPSGAVDPIPLVIR